MPDVPIVVLAGHSNAALGGVDNHIVESLGDGAFEFVKVAQTGAPMMAGAGVDWSPLSTGELFDRLVAETNAAIANVIAQGGTPVVSLFWIMDADPLRHEPFHTLADQVAAVDSMIESFRAEIGYNAHVTVTLSPDEPGGGLGTARDVQQGVALSVGNAGTVDTIYMETLPETLNWVHEAREMVADQLLAEAGVVAPTIPGYDNLLEPASFAHVGTYAEAWAPRFEDYRITYTESRLELHSYSGDDRITTGDFYDRISTGGNDDWISSGGGRDKIFAGDGKDFIRAGDGDDIIEGGLGEDTIYGGEGADLFVFNPGDSGASRFTADRIMDWDEGDVVDLSALGDDLHFLPGRFDGTAGAIRLDVGTNIAVMIDLDGNRFADFTVILVGTGAHGFDPGDFLL